jgi:hypothetical protein
MQAFIVVALCGVGFTIAVLALAAYVFGPGNVQSWLTATSGWAQLLAAIGAAWFAYGQLIEMKNQLAESRRSSAVQAETLLRQYFSEIEAHEQILEDSRKSTTLLPVLAELSGSSIYTQEELDADSTQALKVLFKLEQELSRPSPTVATADIKSKCGDFDNVVIRLENKFAEFRLRIKNPEALAAAGRDAGDYYEANFNQAASECLIALQRRQRVLSDQIGKIDEMVLQQ